MTVSSDTLLMIDIDAVVVVQVEGCELTTAPRAATMRRCDDATGRDRWPRCELDGSKEVVIVGQG